MARAIAFAAVCCALDSGHLKAQLPSLNEAPWIGHFAGHSTSRGSVGVQSDGVIVYNGSHDIHPSVQETSSDGKVTIHRLMPETLKSQMQPTDKPTTITYSGKVKNGTTIEVTIEFVRNQVSIGGAITDPRGRENAQHFALFIIAPAYYLMYGERLALEQGTAAEKKKMEQTIAGQRAHAAKEYLELSKLDGKRIKQPLIDAVDLSSEEFNGDGFNSIKLDLNWFRGRKLDIAATERSRLMLSNKEKRPIFKNHYYITWTEAPGTQSPGKGRMVISMR